MALEITGKVIAILPQQSGISAKGNKWVRYSFVIETQEQYPKKVLFTCTDEEKWNRWNIAIDAQYQVSFNVNAREWQGKWFNDVEAWRVVGVNGNNTQSAQQTNTVPTPQPSQVVEQPSTTNSNGESDLPF